MAQPQRPPIVGELVVVALKARNLPPQLGMRMALYCHFKIAGEARTTKVAIPGGPNPIWDDQVNIPVPAGNVPLEMTILHKAPRKPEPVAIGKADLSFVLKTGEQDGWFSLKFQDKPAGEIYLELTYYASRLNRSPQGPVPFRQRNGLPPGRPISGNMPPPHHQNITPGPRPIPRLQTGPNLRETVQSYPPAVASSAPMSMHSVAPPRHQSMLPPQQAMPDSTPTHVLQPLDRPDHHMPRSSSAVPSGQHPGFVHPRQPAARNQSYPELGKGFFAQPPQQQNGSRPHSQGNPGGFYPPSIAGPARPPGPNPPQVLSPYPTHAR
ncbi:hypothetical protein BZG36_04389 [Bifiguratus adelaidae]|uniref:C2 domain-containing protein n=1 Tax=Bifiguratus adelaidae TaxID=1938954 RepID=A0A261XVS4_9FUNG|nr:hypothetical protein BZG36_04389 [Bifiguratus adelaidae]